MEPLYFVMAIMGCGDGGQQCQQTRVEPVRYQTAAQCRAAMAGALTRHTDLSFPIVQAACEQRGVSWAQKDQAPRG